MGDVKLRKRREKKGEGAELYSGQVKKEAGIWENRFVEGKKRGN